jgi:hypothetical protein
VWDKATALARKEDAMEVNACTVREWLDAHEQGMIHCPYQPGKLMISKDVCLKRHEAALQERYDDMLKVSFFHYKLKKGLFLCSSCPIGKVLACSVVTQPQPISVSASAL